MSMTSANGHPPLWRTLGTMSCNMHTGAPIQVTARHPHPHPHPPVLMTSARSTRELVVGSRRAPGLSARSSRLRDSTCWGVTVSPVGGKAGEGRVRYGWSG